MTFDLASPQVLALVVLVAAVSGGRVLSAILPAGAALTLGEADASHINGQRLCLGGARPACYKMAYFHHVSSRVDFWEAELACRVDGGHLVSIRTPQEQKHIQTLLEVAAAAALLTSFAISDLTFGRRSPTSSSSPSSPRSALSPTSSSPSVSRSSPSSHHHRRHRLRHRPHPSRRADDDDDERHPSDGVAPCPQRYRWTDGSAAAFREWHSDEPSCGAESCVVMYHQPGVGGAYLYQWNDDRCSMKHNFICKYQPERHPEEERGTTAAGRGAETTPDGNHVTLTGTSGPLALYVLLPAIPLLLILAAAAARYCRAPGKSPAARQGHLWISKTHKGGGAEP